MALVRWRPGASAANRFQDGTAYGLFAVCSASNSKFNLVVAP